MFKDVTPLLAEPDTFAEAVGALADPFRTAEVHSVVGIEARGFILASPVALDLGAGFVPVRKAGKLPAATLRQPYALEYGEAVLEMHTDAFPAGSRVLIVDDVLATGGTAAATATLVRQAGGVPVGLAVLLELAHLGGRGRLEELPLHALLSG